MSEDIWAEFDDWLKDGGPGGKWPTPLEEEDFSPVQMQIIERNAKLLLDRGAWKKRVKAFDIALNTIEDAEQRKQMRIRFSIRFDFYAFDREQFPNLNFNRYVFPCSVSFNSVKFGDGDVSFRYGIFFDNAFFKSALFGDGEVIFTSTTFENADLDLSPIYSSNNTSFSFYKMIVEGNFDILGNFSSAAKFTGLKVTESTILSISTFKECPVFRDAQFGRPPEVAGMSVPPPKMRGNKLFCIFNTCSDDEDVARYRKLKAMALAANDHDKDGEFFAYEMMAKRGVDITGFWELLANSFYYHVSNHGQSWIRPLIGMAISCFVFFWIYFIYAMGSLKCLENVWFSIRYSLLNTLPFVSALYRSSIQPKDYQSGLMVDLDKLATVNGEMVNGSLGGLMFFSFIQQIIGIVLLFFLLLGLRNRFRLK